MPVFESTALLKQLELDARDMHAQVAALRTAPNEVLNQAPAAGSWSIAQVLEHLNVYSCYYLPQLQQRLQSAGPQQESFRSGWLGHYFTNLMEPPAGGKTARRMKAPKNAQPAPVLDGSAVVQAFLKHQETLIQLLAGQHDLSVRIPTSLSPLIRLQAGDTFRFLLAHQRRHMAQAHRAAAAIGFQW